MKETLKAIELIDKVYNWESDIFRIGDVGSSTENMKKLRLKLLGSSAIDIHSLSNEQKEGYIKKLIQYKEWLLRDTRGTRLLDDLGIS